MRVDYRILSLKSFKIIPNAFVPLEVTQILKENFYKIKKVELNFHFLRLELKKWKRRIKKMIKIIKIH